MQLPIKTARFFSISATQSSSKFTKSVTAASCTEVVDTNGSGHGALAGFLMQRGVDTLICGGIGGGAQMALAQAGIRLLNGTLTYNPDVHCNHHDHGEGSHTCGDHGCGHHSYH